MKLYTETTGSGPDLFLVHGWGLNSGVWSGLVGTLSERYRVTTVDLPGHGQSRCEDGVDLDSASEALLAAAPDSATWIAWSLGGMLALAAAAHAGERIKSLLLVCSSPRFVASPDWPHAMDEAVLSQFNHNLHQDYQGTLNRFLALQVRGSEAAGPTLRELRNTLVAQGEPNPTALAAGLAMLCDADLRPLLPDLKLPCHFIMGERDTLMPAAAAHAACAAMPNASMQIIAGAGHAPFLSHPEAFMHASLAFLDPNQTASKGTIAHVG